MAVTAAHHKAAPAYIHRVVDAEPALIAVRNGLTGRVRPYNWTVSIGTHANERPLHGRHDGIIRVQVSKDSGIT